MDLSRFKISLEQKDVEVIKATIFVLAIFNIFLFLSATFFLVKGLFTLSYILSLGVITYLLAIFYEVERVENKLLGRLEGKLKRFFEVMIRLVTGGVFVLMVFLLIIYFLNLPFYRFSLYDHMLSLFAIPILVFPLIFWSRLVGFLKGRLGKGLLLVGLIFLLIPIALGANKTNQTNQTEGGLSENLEDISETISTFQKVLGTINKGVSFFKKQRDNVQEIFGLTKGQSNVFMVLLLLVAAFIALKIIRTLIKWAIIIIIVWLFLQFIGVVGSLPPLPFLP